jgi:hypothetical protein
MAVQFSPLMESTAVQRSGPHPIFPRTIQNRNGTVQSSSTPTTFASTATLPSTNPPATTTVPPSSPGSSYFSSLFPVTAATIPAPAAPADPVPTVQSVFGAAPWISNPTGTGPTGAFSYNPYYFATPQTAATVASMVGGKVVSLNSFSTPGSVYKQNQPNEMVQLPNGALINPGLVAEFYTHGYPQSMVNQMIANEVANVSEGN